MLFTVFPVIEAGSLLQAGGQTSFVLINKLYYIKLYYRMTLMLVRCMLLSCVCQSICLSLYQNG